MSDGKLDLDMSWFIRAVSEGHNISTATFNSLEGIWSKPVAFILLFSFLSLIVAHSTVVGWNENESVAT